MNKRSAEESKIKILGAARSIFAEHGYAEASMRAIARQAGISVGGLYLYFRNKEELYLTFMQDWMKKLNDRTRDALIDLDNQVEEAARPWPKMRPWKSSSELRSTLHSIIVKLFPFRVENLDFHSAANIKKTFRENDVT